jgi:hypothetical protein
MVSRADGSDGRIAHGGVGRFGLSATARFAAFGSADPALDAQWRGDDGGAYLRELVGAGGAGASGGAAATPASAAGSAAGAPGTDPPAAQQRASRRAVAAVHLLLGRRATVSRAGRVSIKVRNTTTESLAGRIRLSGRKLQASAPVRLAAGRTATVRVKLGRKALRRLRRARSLSVTVSALLRTRAGRLHRARGRLLVRARR